MKQMATSAIVVSTDKQHTPVRTERVYVGIDLGYREHVGAATPLQAFNPQRQPDGWKRVKTLKFGSDAAGYQRLQRHLERCSADPADFLVLLEAARAELLDQVQQLLASHPYTPIIESLPIKSPIWTATLIAAIGDMRRFNDHREFRRYLGWTPEVAKSGSSTDQSKLARSRVRIARGALGQMALILLAPSVRNTAFREDYQRMIERHVRPATAVGHLAGKLSTVLYRMLRTMTSYDEAKHRREMGLPPLNDANRPAETPLEIEMNLVDPIEHQEEQPADGAVPTDPT